MPSPSASALRKVTELYGRHEGEDIYVVGTGASTRVFPFGFLEGKITIGLNLAWELFEPTYGITFHPDVAVPEFLEPKSERPAITWVTKWDKTVSLPQWQQDYAAENFYFYRSDGRLNTQPPHEPSDAGRFPGWLTGEQSDRLYQWSSISQTAVHFAANLGARNVVLIGCDNSALGGNYHHDGQSTRWRGVEPDYRYAQYHEGLAEVRASLRKRDVNVLSLSALLVLANPLADYERLCAELDKPLFVPAQDVSTRQHGWHRSSLIKRIRYRAKQLATEVAKR